MILDLIKLARPTQWQKGVFVLIGPLYAAAVGTRVDWAGVACAFVAFGLVSSACYIVNDIRDREADRAHHRKKHRAIAAGRVTIRSAVVFAVILLGLGAAVVVIRAVVAPASGWDWRWLAAWLGLYVVNVNAYSAGVKRVIVLDVISLAAGFVLRVLAGCAAAGVEPSTWLLNCTFFVSMFLAFGKRLGERRTMGNAQAATGIRSVHAEYTDDLLRLFLVVTGVMCLVTYAGYVQAREAQFTPVQGSSPGPWGFNTLWLTMLPATYGLLRCVVLVERGSYDDPTELATHDRPFQAAVVLFGLLTVLAVVLARPA